MKFLNAQKPLVTILKYCGFFTFEVPFDGSLVNSSYQNVFISIVTGLLIQGFFIFSHLLYLNNFGNYSEDGNFVSMFVTHFEGYTIIICSSMVFFSVVFLRRKHIKFLDAIIELEEAVNALQGTQGRYNESLRKNTLRFVIFHLLFHVTFFTFYAAVLPENTFPYLFLDCLSFAFFMFLIILVIKFMQNLVEKIANLLDELDENFKNFVSSCPLHFYDKELKNLFILRDRTIETIKLFNGSFGIIVLGIFILVLGIATFELYYAAANYLDMNASSDWMMILILASNIFFVFPLLTTFSMLGFTCESVRIKVSQVQNSSPIVHSTIAGKNDQWTPEDHSTGFVHIDIMHSTEGLPLPITESLFSFLFASYFSWFNDSFCTPRKWKRTSPQMTYSSSTMRFATTLVNHFMINRNLILCQSIKKLPFQLITAIVTFLVVLIQFREAYEEKKGIWLAHVDLAFAYHSLTCEFISQLRCWETLSVQSIFTALTAGKDSTHHICEQTSSFWRLDKCAGNLFLKIVQKHSSLFSKRRALHCRYLEQSPSQ